MSVPVPVRYSAANFVIDSDMQMNEDLMIHHQHQMSSTLSSSLSPSKMISSSSSIYSSPQQQQQQDEMMIMNTHDEHNINNNNNNNGGVNNNNNYEAEMRDQWMMMPDGGRLGTPDAAAGCSGKQYDKQQQQHHILEQQELIMMQATQTQLLDNGNNNNQSQQQNHQQQLNSSTSSSLTNNTLDNGGQNFVSSEDLINKLKEYDTLQDKYHTVLLMPKESKREVTSGGRDGSAYVLRCLKMWYELPSDVLFAAISLVDRFLDRMTVKPKHMACMSVASFYLAIEQLGLDQIPADDLVTISQCGCTAGDLDRMAGVIANKLGVQMGHPPTTSLSFLRIYYQLFRNMAEEIGGQFFEFYKQFIKLEELEMRLEVLLCDVKTTVITPSIMALVLMCLHLDLHIKESYIKGSPELKTLFEYILFLQKFLRIPDRVFTCGFSIVSGILSHYNGQNKQPYKQRLVWKLSSRTLRVLRPTNRFSSDLYTIDEGIGNQQQTIDEMDGCRSRTESLSSEEEEDWPTSPIIPIFEQC